MQPAMINRRSRQRLSAASLSSREGLVWVVDEEGNGIWMPVDRRDPAEDPFHNFTEWAGEADHKAYDKL